MRPLGAGFATALTIVALGALGSAAPAAACSQSHNWAANGYNAGSGAYQKTNTSCNDLNVMPYSTREHFIGCWQYHACSQSILAYANGLDTILWPSFGLNDWATEWTRDYGIYQTALLQV
jgi:hypothetical protein